MSTPPDDPIDVLRKRVERLEAIAARPAVTGPTEAQIDTLAEEMRRIWYDHGCDPEKMARAAYAHISAERGE